MTCESGSLSSEYVAEETTVNEAMNIHLALESMRERATATGTQGESGPRLLILGPDNVGKTTLAKTLTGYAIRSGRAPVVVGLDPSEGILSLPGTLSATVFKTLIEIESDAGGGWGSSPMSGPNGEIPVKLPLVYYFGGTDPAEKNGVQYRSLITRLALATQGRMKAAGQENVDKSGIIVDTPGTLLSAQQASGGYELVAHIVSEFSINAIVCLGSERLYNDMVRKFDKQPVSGMRGSENPSRETIAVIKLAKSGGVVDRDAAYMRAVAEAQIRAYFYGNPNVGTNISLQPRQQQVDWNALPTVWRRISSNSTYTGGNSMNDEFDGFLPGGVDEDDYVPPPAEGFGNSSVPLPESQLFEKISSPVTAIRNCVLAVMNCPPDPDDQGVLRDSSCMGFLYVTDIDEGKGKISLLSPVAGRVPNRALVWGEGIEGILGIVN